MKRNMNEACYPFFSTLTNPTRITILELLHEGTKNVMQISEALNQEQRMISHNLKLLDDADSSSQSEKRKSTSTH